MSVRTRSVWARRYLVIAVVFLVTWQTGVVFGMHHRTEVILGIYGFVFHTIFGKSYSLIPSYFDRELAAMRAPMFQFPLTVLGTVFLAGGSVDGWGQLAWVGSVLWASGVGVFLGTLFWTIRSNISGGATGTGGANAARETTDRIANAFVPIALLYLLVGTYETVAIHTTLPTLVTEYQPAVTHLLAAGTGALLVFAIGFRILPRFLVVHPPRASVVSVLVPGALGPVLLAGGLTGSPVVLRSGMVLEGVAITVFAGTVAWMLFRSDRQRIGLYGVLFGVLFGIIGVVLGGVFAFDQVDAILVKAHFRLNVLGFLGLVITGMIYQFYPPSIGSSFGVTEATARASIGSIVLGLSVQIIGLIGGYSLLVGFGELLTGLGGFLVAWVTIGVFRDRSL